MQNRSTTITGVIVIIASVCAMLGIELSQEDFTNIMDLVIKLAGSLTALISAVIVWSNRVKKGDVKLLGMRKDKA